MKHKRLQYVYKPTQMKDRTSSLGIHLLPARKNLELCICEAPKQPISLFLSSFLHEVFKQLDEHQRFDELRKRYVQNMVTLNSKIFTN